MTIGRNLTVVQSTVFSPLHSYGRSGQRHIVIHRPVWIDFDAVQNNVSGQFLAYTRKAILVRTSKLRSHGI